MVLLVVLESWAQVCQCLFNSFRNYSKIIHNFLEKISYWALSCNNTSLFNYSFSLNFNIYEDILLLEHLLYALNIWVGHHYHQVLLSLQPHFTCLFLMIVSKPPNLSSPLAPLQFAPHDLHMSTLVPLLVNYSSSLMHFARSQ